MIGLIHILAIAANLGYSPLGSSSFFFVNVPNVSTCSAVPNPFWKRVMRKRQLLFHTLEVARGTPHWGHQQIVVRWMKPAAHTESCWVQLPVLRGVAPGSGHRYIDDGDILTVSIQRLSLPRHYESSRRLSSRIDVLDLNVLWSILPWKGYPAVSSNVE